MGLLFTLFGLKFSKVILFLSGFFAFAIPTFSIMGGFTLMSNRSLDSQLLIDFLVAGLLGVAGGFIVFYCQKVAVFFVGFSCGFALFFLLTAIAFNMASAAAVSSFILLGIIIFDKGPAAVLGFVGGIIGGVLAILLFE